LTTQRLIHADVSGKFKNRTIKKDILFLIILVILIIYILISSKISEKNRIENCIKSCNSDKELYISGIVIDKKFVGDNNKGIETIYILQNNFDTVMYYSSWHRDLNFVELGDSLFKMSGTFDILIYRKGELLSQILAANSDCNCRCSDNPKDCIEK
jgi:hypothetical protein